MHTKIQTDLSLAGLRGSPPYSYRVMECIAGVYRWYLEMGNRKPARPYSRNARAVEYKSQKIVPKHRLNRRSRAAESVGGQSGPKLFYIDDGFIFILGLLKFYKIKIRKSNKKYSKRISITTIKKVNLLKDRLID